MDWNIVDVAIGISAIYLVLSVAVSTINETISAIFSLRARNLSKAISTIIGDARKAALYSHPLVQGMAVSSKLPTYIPAETFASALVSITAPAAAHVAEQTYATFAASVNALPATDPLKPTLTALMDDANGDYATFKRNLAKWFDSAMDRASGGYKRLMHVLAAAAAVAVTLAANVNSIDIFDRLWTDSAVRASLAAAASAPGSQDLQERAQQVGAALDLLTLPIGWHGTDANATWWQSLGAAASGNGLWGWLLTIVAASLGAPFWFDALNRFVNVRATGPKPQKVDDAASAGSS